MLSIRLFAAMLAVLLYDMQLSAVESTARPAVGDAVFIVISGELLHDYARATGDPRTSEEPEKTVNITTGATISHVTEDGRYAIQHRVSLESVGEPPRLLEISALVPPSQFSIAPVQRKRTWTRGTPYKTEGDHGQKTTHESYFLVDLAELDRVRLRVWTLDEETKY